MDAGRGFPAPSETLSTSKSRFGFQDSQLNFVPLARATPILHKSASVENVAPISAVRSISQRFDEDEVGGGDGSVCQSFDFSEDPSFWKDNNVQVIIRVRPLSSTEISLQGYSKCTKQENSQTILWTGHPESRFTFDLVADENVSQENLFKVAGLSMVENCIGGYNSCMFAYGQTGSGKTHTMLGDIEGGTRRHSVNCGITPRVFEHLFSRIQKEKEDRKDDKLMFSCKCSFLEIYNEQILDLLDPSSTNLHIREDIKKGVYVENLKEIEVKSAREVLQHLIEGAANRKVASTNMNRASSRSHSVFTCIIESQWESQGVTHHRFARLNLVDLAGSERQKSSGAEGERLKEATNINKSLSTLGLVIMNLVSLSNGKSLHVPYRDSKLTFLLQDSLGGNSKTIIIANISPASCCSLETLSTLKFAQRAKFIKNNAIVNEDSSGDVIAMRLQIQQLKKEIARLRGYTGGADNQDIDTMTVSFLGSPGSFKWEGLGGLCSPLTMGKGISQKRDYEVTLVGAFKREKEKDLAFQALAAENQAAMQLAKQREDEIQGLKMRLRFREAGIKRLEAVVSGKISAETYLLKEKEENLKEIDVLKTQVDRNQEATRFAMENLRLKEDIRRLKSFYEEGEREFMDEQIKVLQSKLLEALDWKLMHESNPSTTQIANSSMLAETCNDDNLLILDQELRSPRKSFINEENEFLRMQIIQNQAELDSLSQKLELCLEEKERLESHVNELISKLEAEKSHSRSGVNQIDLPLWSTDNPIVNPSDQTELKTMVDAIAAASQREAEAHEKVIRISNENDELRMKVNILIEDNKNLIEMYEKVSLECTNKEINKSETTQYVAEKDIELQKMIDNLEHQLVEIHEENDKLMGLYEEAMQEKDELKRMVSTLEQRKSNFEALDCPERLVMVDEGINLEIYDPTTSIDKRNLVPGSSFSRVDEVESQNCVQGFNLSIPEDSMEVREDPDSMDDEGEVLSTENSVGEVDVESQNCVQGFNLFIPEDSMEVREGPDSMDDEVEVLSTENSVGESSFSETVENSVLKLDSQNGPNPMEVESFALADDAQNGPNPPQMEVESSALADDAQNGPNPSPQMEAESSALVEKLHDHLNMVKAKVGKAAEQLSDTSNTLASFSLLEKLIFEAHNLSREIELLEDEFQVKQNQLESNEVLSSDIRKRRSLALNKLSALKYTISSLSASLDYFEEREATTRVRRKASKFYLEQKKREMGSLQILKNEMESAKRKIQNSEDELRNRILSLKSKLKEENKKQENDKVLFAIDNVERIEPTFKTLHLGGKATELLKSEEEKTKLQAEMKLCGEKLSSRKRELEEITKKSAKLDTEIKTVELEIKKAMDSVEEMELKFKTAAQEKRTLLETREIQQTEMENIILDYQECVYSEDLKAAEQMVMEEELEMEFRRIQEKQIVRTALKEKAVQLLKLTNEDLKNLGSSIVEARLLLEKGQ